LIEQGLSEELDVVVEKAPRDRRSLDILSVKKDAKLLGLATGGYSWIWPIPICPGHFTSQFASLSAGRHSSWASF